MTLEDPSSGTGAEGRPRLVRGLDRRSLLAGVAGAAGAAFLQAAEAQARWLSRSPGLGTPVAWLLYRNEVLPEDAVLDATTLPAVRMPARDRFVVDDRAGGSEVR